MSSKTSSFLTYQITVNTFTTMSNVREVVHLRWCFHGLHLDIMDHLLQNIMTHINNSVLDVIAIWATIIFVFFSRMIVSTFGTQCFTNSTAIVVGFFLYSHLIGNFIECFKELQKCFKVPPLVEFLDNGNVPSSPWKFLCHFQLLYHRILFKAVIHFRSLQICIWKYQWA